MKKGLIIALAVVLVLGLSGVALAWNVDLDADVHGAYGGVFGGGGGLHYNLDTFVEINGRGVIDVDGSGDADTGFMQTTVGGSYAQGAFYASQDLYVHGAFRDLHGDPLYQFEAHSFVRADSVGEIDLRQGVGEGLSGPVNGNFQVLSTEGWGTFQAEMSSSLAMSEPETHTMGVYGTNVDWSVRGETWLHADDGTYLGFLTDLILEFN